MTMDHFLRLAACLVFIALLRVHNIACGKSKNCAELEFEGLKSTEKLIEIKKSSYINLTATLQTSGCGTNKELRFRIKVSFGEKGFVVDVCKIILDTGCNKSHSSNAACRCLSKRSVQLLKKADLSDSGPYTWTWTIINDAQPGLEKTRDIFISVVDDDKYSGTAAAVSVTCVFVSVIVAVTGIWIFRKRRTSEGVMDIETEFHAHGQQRQSTDGDNVSDDHIYEDDVCEADIQTYDHLDRL